MDLRHPKNKESLKEQHPSLSHQFDVFNDALDNLELLKEPRV